MTKTRPDLESICTVPINLEEIIPQGHSFDTFLKELESKIPQIKNIWEALGNEEINQWFVSYMEFFEKLTEGSWRLIRYAQLLRDSGIDRKAGAEMIERAAKFREKVNSDHYDLMLQRWIEGEPIKDKPQLTDELAKTLFEQRGGRWKNYLEIKRREKVYDPLSQRPKFETRFNERGRKAGKWELGLREMKFPFVSERFPEGCGYTSLSHFFYSHDPKLREAAFDALFTGCGELKGRYYPLAQEILTDWRAELNERGYRSPTHWLAEINDIPPEAFEAVESILPQQTALFQEFIGLKAKALRLPQFRRCDAAAPLSHEANSLHGDGDLDLVISIIEGIDPEFATAAREMDKKGHIDCGNRDGKIHNAYAYDIVPGFLPYLIFNKTESINDLLGLFHEFGHTYQIWLARHCSPFSFRLPKSLVEIPSLFLEISGGMALMEKYRDSKDELLIRAALLDNIFSKAVKEAYYTKFELLLQQAVIDGKSAEDVSDQFASLQRERYGNDVILPPSSRDEWVILHHMVSRPLNSVSYCLGVLVASYLVEETRMYGNRGLEKAKAFFSFGSTTRPKEMFGSLGFDLTSPETLKRLMKPWKESVERVVALIDRYPL